MSVDVDGSRPAVSFGTPRKLLDMAAITVTHPGPAGYTRYAVSHDGQRFLIPSNPRGATFSDSTSPPIAVAVNWAAALKK
jgi:hypothetical protein